MAYDTERDAPTTAKGSRIQSDIHNLQKMVTRVRQAQERVTHHARTLGYFQDTPEPSGMGSKLNPVSTSLTDALADMERALDGLSG